MSPIKSNKIEFIKKAQLVHNNKFEYSLVDYVGSKINVRIICPIHGEFLQRPNDHLCGYGCRKCQYVKTSLENKFSNETFINKSNLIHNNKFDYSLVEYNGYEKKVKIICNKHGVFMQSPHAHLQGTGCPYCKESRGEKKIAEILIKYNIPFQRQYSFKDLFGDLNLLVFDFYLPEHKILIEFDGLQHYKPIKFFGGLEKLKKQRMNDLKKIKYVINNHYKLIKLPYTTLRYLEEALVCELKNCKVLC